MNNNDNDIIKGINSLKNKKSHVNEVPVVISKRNINDLAKPLSILFNQSIRSGKLPNLLKNTNMTPIHKAGSQLILATTDLYPNYL